MKIIFSILCIKFENALVTVLDRQVDALIVGGTCLIMDVDFTQNVLVFNLIHRNPAIRLSSLLVYITFISDQNLATFGK